MKKIILLLQICGVCFLSLHSQNNQPSNTNRTDTNYYWRNELLKTATKNVEVNSNDAPSNNNAQQAGEAQNMRVKDATFFTNQFATYKEKFIDRLWKMYPGWATGVGFHLYDSLLNVPDDTFRIKEMKFVDDALNRLHSISKDSLEISDRTDYALIENFLNQSSWSSKSLRQYEWDPTMYNIAGDFSFLLSETSISLDNRLRCLNNKMNHVHDFYVAAKANLKNPTKEHTALAIKQIKNSLSIFSEDMIDSLNKSKLSATEKLAFTQKANACKTEMNDFANYLSGLDMSHARDFRLGAALYEEKFKYEIQSRYSSSQLLAFAQERKNFLHGEMAKKAIELWPKYFGNKPKPSDTLQLIAAMIDTLSVQHAKASTFQSSIEKQIPILVKFINDKNLIYLDPSKPLKVRLEPAYMAGVAGASISSPGPYDKNGTTYYNVGSISAMSPAEQESYLREYNNYILQILNIHEAIPGHYTQGIYANQSPSIIKSIFGNTSMIEGWAVYSELMMLENGYGGNTPEMWLMYYKWNLRSVCNTILDISVHTQNMSHDEAINLLTKEAFQQSAEAEGKWRRVQLTSVQLCSYFNGFKEIVDLRTAMQKHMGSKFDLKKFHEKLLSFGSIPIKNIREMISNK